MRFAAAEYFYWLSVVPLVAIGGWVSLWRRQRALDNAIDKNLAKRLMPESSREREHVRLVLLVIAVILLVFALARPQFGTHSTLVKRRGVDVVVALDTSKSMLAKDVDSNDALDRLRRAKMELSGLIDRLDGDRIGLVAFAGAAFVQCPLTSDYAAAKLFLRAMKAGSIPQGGTNFSAALKTVQQMFENSRGGSRSKVLVIVSDGEDHEGNYQQNLDQLRQMGVVIHAVGIGTKIGEVIPNQDKGYMRSEGKVVWTKLQEDTLKNLAQSTSGLYIHSAAGDLGFEAIYEELDRMQKSEFEQRLQTVYEEKFQLFVFLALLALLAATIYPMRRDLGKKEVGA